MLPDAHVTFACITLQGHTALFALLDFSVSITWSTPCKPIHESAHISSAIDSDTTCWEFVQCINPPRRAQGLIRWGANTKSPPIAWTQYTLNDSYPLKKAKPCKWWVTQLYIKVQFIFLLSEVGLNVHTCSNKIFAPFPSKKHKSKTKL